MIYYLSGHDSLTLCNQITLDTKAIFKSAMPLVPFKPRDDSVIAASGALWPSQSPRKTLFHDE